MERDGEGGKVGRAASRERLANPFFLFGGEETDALIVLRLAADGEAGFRAIFWLSRATRKTSEKQACQRFVVATAHSLLTASA